MQRTFNQFSHLENERWQCVTGVFVSELSSGVILTIDVLKYLFSSFQKITLSNATSPTDLFQCNCFSRLPLIFHII